MWIEIFKTGTHTDANGSSDKYSAEMLDAIVKKYNDSVDGSPSLVAPVVKGHPKTNDPAYGWVERLARRGDRLMAKLRSISPELARQVKQGMFRKVSMAIYPDLMLRHVGFLGAFPPAVKGLEPVSFAGAEKFLAFENDLSNQPDGEEQSKEIQQDKQAASKEFTELKEKYIRLSDRSAALEKSNVEYLNKIKQFEKETRQKEFREFTNSLIDNPDGPVITPAQADAVIDILEMAHTADANKNGNNNANNNGNKDFAEGRTYVDMVREFVSGFRPAVQMGEFASKDAAVEAVSAREFSNRNVSEDRLKLHEKALDMQNLTPGLTYEEAVCLVQGIAGR